MKKFNILCFLMLFSIFLYGCTTLQTQTLQITGQGDWVKIPTVNDAKVFVSCQTDNDCQSFQIENALEGDTRCEAGTCELFMPRVFETGGEQ